MTPEMLADLRAPFPPESIGKKPTVWCRACELGDCTAHVKKLCDVCEDVVTTAHDHLDFVGHAYVRERLNAVDPDWNWRPQATDAHGLPLFDEHRGLWIWLTIGDKTMPGYGDAPTARRGAAVKECIGDALRNGAMSFGVALDLWKRGTRVRTVEQDSAEQADPVMEERSAKRLREEIRTLGNRRKKKFLAVLQMFEQWANGTAKWDTADADTLAAFKQYLTTA